MGSIFMRKTRWWRIKNRLAVVAVFLVLTKIASGAPLAVAHISGLYALQDKQQTLNLAAVQTRNDWTPLPASVLYAGYSHSAWWLKLTVEVPEQAIADNWLAITPTFLDHIQLYLPNQLMPADIVAPSENQEWKTRTQGDMIAFAERDLNWRGFTYRLNLPPGQHTVYLRVTSTSTVMVAPRLLTPMQFSEVRIQESLLFGAYFGILLLVMIISLLYWWVTRDRLYALYLLLVLGTLSYAAAVNGFITQYLLRDTPPLASASVGISVYLSIAAATLFIPYLLELDRVLPWAAKFQKTTAALYVLASVSVPLGVYSQVIVPVTWMVLCQTVLSVYFAYQAWNKGIRHARFAIPAYLISLSGFMMPFLATLGLIPGGIWAMHAAQVSSLLHLIMLQGVMAARVRGLDEQRRTALLELEVSSHQIAIEKQARQEQRQWVSMISHEFKTPLATIDASAQSIDALLSDHDTQGIAARVNKIRRSVQRVTSLITSCLQEDKIDHAAASFDPQMLDLARFIADFRRNRPLPLNTPLPVCHFSGAPNLYADPHLLALVLGNLLDNARAHGGQNITLTSTQAPRQNRAGTRLSICDDGPGIVKEERERIFEKHMRGNGCRVPGSGFGLWAARRIMLIHGGEIWLEVSENASAPHTGACFELWFPLKEAT